MVFKIRSINLHERKSYKAEYKLNGVIVKNFSEECFSK